MRRNIYIVGGIKHSGYARWMQGTITNNMKDADLVLFTGGEDVDPDFYGHPRHPYTGSNRQRDQFEFLEFEAAKKLEIPCLGICRGLQFLSVASGAVLVQHQSNRYMHKIKTYDEFELMVTSTHHQAAYPFDLPKDDFKIIGWSEDVSTFHENGLREEMNPPKECEIVFYPKTNCLGIQSHPECQELDHPTIVYLQILLDNFLNKKI